MLNQHHTWNLLNSYLWPCQYRNKKKSLFGVKNPINIINKSQIVRVTDCITVITHTHIQISNDQNPIVCLPPISKMLQ